MRHVQVKVFNLFDYKDHQNFEDEINKFIDDRNVISIVALGDHLVMVEWCKSGNF